MHRGATFTPLLLHSELKWMSLASATSVLLTTQTSFYTSRTAALCLFTLIPLKHGSHAMVALLCLVFDVRSHQLMQFYVLPL